MRRSSPEPMVTLIFAMFLLGICLTGLIGTMTVILGTDHSYINWPFMWGLLIVSAICGITGCVLAHKLAKQLS